MKTLVDGAKALELLSEVVEEVGRDVVARCMYVEEFSNSEEMILVPHCIAGRVFDKLGAPIDFLVDMEGLSAKRVAQHFEASYPNEAKFTSQGRDIIDTAQGLQDNGLRWGDVIDRLKEQYVDVTKEEEGN